MFRLSLQLGLNKTVDAATITSPPIPEPEVLTGELGDLTGELGDLTGEPTS